MSCYCEICGREVADRSLCRTIALYSSVVLVCPQCYQKIRSDEQSAALQQQRTAARTSSERSVAWTKKSVSRKMLETMFEVVEDYAVKIKRARERMGWTQAALAQKLRISENVVKRIEAGRLKPSIDLARKLEKLLGIVLLEPIVEEPSSQSLERKSGEDHLTIGDLIEVDEGE